MVAAEYLAFIRQPQGIEQVFWGLPIVRATPRSARAVYATQISQAWVSDQKLILLGFRPLTSDYRPP
jgi:hypothetical protein